MDFFGKDPFNAGFRLAGPSLGQVSQEELQAQLKQCEELRKVYGETYEYWLGQGEAETAQHYLDLHTQTERACRRIRTQIAQGQGAGGYEYQKQAPRSEPAPTRGSFMPSQDHTTAYYQSAPVPTSYYSQPSRASLFPRGGYGSVAFSGGLSGPSLGQDTLEGLKAQHARCIATLKYYITQIEYWTGQGNIEKTTENQGYYDRTARECRGLQERIRQLEAQRLAPGSAVQARGSSISLRDRMTSFRGSTSSPTSYYSQPSRSSLSPWGSVSFSSPQVAPSRLSPFAPTLRGSGFWQELTTTPLSL